MNNMIKTVMILLVLLGLNSCENQSPNIDKTGKYELKSLELDHKIDKGQIQYDDIYYIPIYSDIYVSEQNQKSLFAATLSIRNTSCSDSLFVSKIDYFNTEGRLVPMVTVNYVIEKGDASGGSGANFIVELCAMSKNVKPIIQAIMIGDNGSNQGFAFSTDGYSIKELKVSK